MGSCHIGTACVSSVDLPMGIFFLNWLQLHLSAPLPFPEDDNMFLKYLNTDASLHHWCSTSAFGVEFALYHPTFLLKDRLALLKSPLCSLSVCWSHSPEWWLNSTPSSPHFFLDVRSKCLVFRSFQEILSLITPALKRELDHLVWHFSKLCSPKQFYHDAGISIHFRFILVTWFDF